MNNPFSDPRNFEDPNNPSFLNSYKFENSTSMGRFARQISHNSGVSSINQTDRNILSVDCMSDSIRQDVNTQYLNFTKESVELDELGRGTLRRYREKSKKQISDIEKRGMKKGEKVSSKYKKRLKGRRQATTRLAKKAMEGVEVDERHAPLPKSSEFVVHYPMKDNKQVTKLTKLGGKVDRANKRVVFKFDTAAERTAFRKKNKSVLATITDQKEGTETDIAKEKENIAKAQERIKDLNDRARRQRRAERGAAGGA